MDENICTDVIILLWTLPNMQFVAPRLVQSHPIPGRLWKSGWQGCKGNEERANVEGGI